MYCALAQYSLLINQLKGEAKGPSPKERTLNKTTNQKSVSVRERKRRGRPPKPKQLRIDQSCITGVNPKHTHGLGLWNNSREVWSCRCDYKLGKAFKKVAIAKYGSICNPIETFMAAIIGAYRQEQISGVYPSNTSIDIGSIVINRNMQERRKLTRTHMETETIEEETETVMVCGCGADPVFRVGSEVFCERCFWLQPKPGERIEVS